jgi:dipeptide/tripeptide permease
MYMGVATSGYSTAFFIPTILNQFGYTPTQAQLHTIPIYGVCMVATLLTAWLSDKMRCRYVFTMLGVFIATIGYIMLLAQGPPKGAGAMPTSVRYLAVFFITVGTYITQPLVIVWLSNNMGGHYKRSFSSALQIGLGNIGGIIGSVIYLQSEAPTFHTGYSTGLGMILLCGALCTIFWWGLRRENACRERGERDGRLRLPKEVVENLGDDHPDFRFTS